MRLVMRAGDELVDLAGRDRDRRGSRRRPWLPRPWSLSWPELLRGAGRSRRCVGHGSLLRCGRGRRRVRGRREPSVRRLLDARGVSVMPPTAGRSMPSGIDSQSGGCVLRTKPRRPPCRARMRAAATRPRAGRGRRPGVADTEGGPVALCPLLGAVVQLRGDVGVGQQVTRLRSRSDRSMPATSRSGLDSARALGERPGRLALEVQEHPAVVGAQHLAEVEVAVHPLQLRARSVSARQPSKTASQTRRECARPAAGTSPPPRPAAASCRCAARPSSRRPAAVRVGSACGEQRRAPRGRRPEPLGLGRRSRRRPRRRAGRPRRRGRARSRAASAQPSVAVRRNACSTPSVVGSVPCDRRRSIQPRDAARRAGCRPRSGRGCTSRSGFTPGASRRNSLRIACSP